jgi:hypothetical protein
MLAKSTTTRDIDVPPRRRITGPAKIRSGLSSKANQIPSSHQFINEGRLPTVFKQYMPVPPTYVWFNIPNPVAPFHLPFLVFTSLPQHCTISDLLMRACVWVLFLFRLEQESCVRRYIKGLSSCVLTIFHPAHYLKFKFCRYYQPACYFHFRRRPFNQVVDSSLTSKVRPPLATVTIHLQFLTFAVTPA